MNEPQGKGKFAVSSGPVNRRTATPAQRAERTNHAPVVLSRLKAAQAKHRLGASLRQRLSSEAVLPGARHKASGTLVIQAIGCTLGGTGMFLGIIQSAWPVAALGAATVAGLGAWMLLARRTARRNSTAPVGYVAPWIEPEHLERLDALMEATGQGIITEHRRCAVPTERYAEPLWRASGRRCYASTDSTR